MPNTNTMSPEGMPPAPRIQHSREKLHGRLSSGVRQPARAMASAEHGRHCAGDSRYSTVEIDKHHEKKLRKHERSQKSLYSSSRHRALSASGDWKARDVHGIVSVSAQDAATSSNEVFSLPC